MARKSKRPAWVRGTKIERQLGLLRWLARRGDWVATKEIATNTFGVNTTQRRALHRDLCRLVEGGVPIERADGWWRLRPRAFAVWLKKV